MGWTPTEPPRSHILKNWLPLGATLGSLNRSAVEPWSCMIFFAMGAVLYVEDVRNILSLNPLDARHTLRNRDDQMRPDTDKFPLWGEAGKRPVRAP